jgi:hypothetical protein
LRHLPALTCKACTTLSTSPISEQIKSKKLPPAVKTPFLQKATIFLGKTAKQGKTGKTGGRSCCLSPSGFIFNSQPCYPRNLSEAVPSISLIFCRILSRSGFSIWCRTLTGLPPNFFDFVFRHLPLPACANMRTVPLFGPVNNPQHILVSGVPTCFKKRLIVEGNIIIDKKTSPTIFTPAIIFLVADPLRVFPKLF